MPSFRGASQPRDRSQVCCIAGGFFIIWATGEAHELAEIDWNHQGVIPSSYPFSSSPSASIELWRVRALLFIRLWPKGMLWLIQPSIKPWNLLHLDNKAVLHSYHSCVDWGSTFSFLQELFLCNHNLTVRHKRPRFWLDSAFYMPFSLNLIIFSFNLKWDTCDLSFHLDT